MPVELLDGSVGNSYGVPGKIGFVLLSVSASLKFWNKYAPGLETVNEWIVTGTAVAAFVLIFFQILNKRASLKLTKLEIQEKEKEIKKQEEE